MGSSRARRRRGIQTEKMHRSTRSRALLQDLAALIWPTECVSCGAPNRDCCDSCVAELRECVMPAPSSIGVPVYARSSYSGAFRALLVAFKHHNRFGFGRVLGRHLRLPLMAALHGERRDRPPVLVTVPSRPGRVRSRGYRHVDVLLGIAARGSGLPRLRALRTTRGRVGQVGLDASDRARNAARITVRGSCRNRLRDRDIVLVDDIMTTGATILGARAALEGAGATVIAVVVLCRSERRDTRPENQTGNGESEWSRLPERRKGAPHWPTA